MVQFQMLKLLILSDKNKFMKYYITVLFSIFSFYLINAQEKSYSEFNKWSVEFNTGQNKPIKPFANGYYSSNPTKYLYFNGLQHFDLGIRYMFNPYFGAKFDFAYDFMNNVKGSSSLPFENKQYRFGLQGVANLSALLKFNSFTKSFGLLFHTGLQFSKLTPQIGVNENITEDNGGFMIGFKPQFKISNRIVLTGDFTYLANIRQHFNWDGSYADMNNNLTGSLINTTLGLTFYLGKKKEHLDWYIEQKDSLSNVAQAYDDKEIKQRLEVLEQKILNSNQANHISNELNQKSNNLDIIQKLDILDNKIDALVNDTKERIVVLEQNSDALNQIVKKTLVNLQQKKDIPNKLILSDNKVHNVITNDTIVYVNNSKPIILKNDKLILSDDKVHNVITNDTIMYVNKSKPIILKNDKIVLTENNVHFIANNDSVVNDKVNFKNSNIAYSNNDKIDLSNQQKHDLDQSLYSNDPEYKAITEFEYNVMYYDNNRIDPNKESRKKLIYIINFLKKNPQIRIRLDGYTDSLGTINSNLKLSQRRVENLKSILISYNINPDRIETNAKGIDTIFSNNNKLEEPLSRRVSIFFLNK